MKPAESVPPPTSRARRLGAHLLPLAVVAALVSTAIVGVNCALAPLNASPSDVRWAVTLGGLTLALGALALTTPSWGFRAWSLVAAASGGFLLLAKPENAISLALLVWILGAAIVAGDRVVLALGLDRATTLAARLTLAATLGLGAIAALTFTLAATRLLYAPLAFLALLVLSVPARETTRHALRPGFGRVRDWCIDAWNGRRSAEEIVSLLAASVAVAGCLVWALAPGIQYDVLNYHLGATERYVAQHGFVELPECFESYWCHWADMLFTFGLLLKGQPVPSLLHWASFLIGAGFVVLLAREIGAGRRGAAVAASLWLSTPMLVHLAGTAMTDLLVGVFALGAVYAAVVWSADPESNPGWLVVLGVMTGLAVGSKLSAALLLLPVGIGVVAVAVRRTGGWRGVRARVLLAAVPAAVLVTPWLIRDAAWTGNPIYPFLEWLFDRSQAVALSSRAMFSPYGHGHALLTVVALPWDLAARTAVYGEGYPPSGAIGVLSLLAIAATIGGRALPARARRALAALGLLAATMTLLWFLTAQVLRYLVPVIGIASALAGLAVRLVVDTVRSRWKAAGHVVLAALLVHFAGARLVTTYFHWQIPDRYPLAVATGRETDEAFLARAVPVYEALRFLDANGGASAKVLSLGNEFRAYTSARIFGFDSSREAMSVLESEAAGDHLAARLRVDGYTHILANSAELSTRPWSARLPILAESFLSRWTVLSFVRSGVRVYTIRTGPATGTAPGPSLLTNPGFEEIAGDTPAGWFRFGAATLAAGAGSSHGGIRAASSAGAADGFYQRVRIRPGRVYRLTLWARSADRAPGLARLQINWLGEGLEMVAVSIEPVRTTAVWEEHSLVASSPAAATWAQVYACGHESAHVLLDDFSLAEVR